MPTILIQVCDAVRNYLPRLVQELAKANELKAIELKALTGMVAAATTCKAVDAVMGKP